jgi:steroid 5-alpha reductase family enzyme
MEGPIVFNLVLGVVLYLLINKFDNWSWVDRIWGLMPIGFALHFLAYQKYC